VSATNILEWSEINRFGLLGDDTFTCEIRFSGFGALVVGSANHKEKERGSE
jgi:hypothetical protein